MIGETGFNPIDNSAFPRNTQRGIFPSAFIFPQNIIVLIVVISFSDWQRFWKDDDLKTNQNYLQVLFKFGQAHVEKLQI